MASPLAAAMAGLTADATLLATEGAAACADVLAGALTGDACAIQRASILEGLAIDAAAGLSGALPDDGAEGPALLHLRRQVMRQWRGFSHHGARLAAASKLVFALVSDESFIVELEPLAIVV